MSTDESQFALYPIKNYSFWTVYLYKSQAYLGRCKIALNRPGAVDPFTDTTAEEQSELATIITKLQATLHDLYQPDLLNYANLRNTWHRCHWHVIPRYAAPRTIGGQQFVDDNWGKNYAPYDRTFKIHEDLMAKIQHDITAKLESSH
jgi:diadenosine tetraphosphate (Ap4A) HIT family hydrolase